MTGHTTFLLFAIALLTTTQAFTWGRVFNNNNENNSIKAGDVNRLISKEPEEPHTPTVHEETEVAERPLLEETVSEREKSFRAARTEGPQREEKKSLPLEGVKSPLGEEKTNRRPVEAMTPTAGMEQKADRDADLHTLQKEVAEIKQPLGPDAPPERVEVVGVPREREHHITDGLADAISGLMRVYNSLVRSDGRLWESSVYPSVSGGTYVKKDGTNSTSEETVRVVSKENEKKGGWAPLAVLAGIVVVAGAAVLLVGFAQREREGPVYPPRGPAYV